MRDFVITRATMASRIGAVGALVLLVFLLSAPWWAGRADIRLITEILFYMALASMWNLLAGYTGLVSVGQHAYVGFGGYLMFTCAIFLGVSPIVAIPIAGLAAAAISIPVAFLVFRLQGAYFAIGTWVVAEVFRLSFSQIQSLGGGSGLSIPIQIMKEMGKKSEREMIIYYTALALSLGALVMVYLILRSRVGLALTAIRDSEVASSSLGVRIGRIKLAVYVAVAGVTSMIGALIFVTKLRITPDAAFSLNDWTGFVIFIVVIGGIGTIEGPIVGTLLYFLLREWLSDLGSIYLMILGAMAIGIMFAAPKGIWGLINERFGISLFPVGYRVEAKNKD